MNEIGAVVNKAGGAARKVGGAAGAAFSDPDTARILGALGQGLQQRGQLRNIGGGFQIRDRANPFGSGIQAALSEINRQGDLASGIEREDEREARKRREKVLDRRGGRSRHRATRP